eukprot:690773-Pleurochrysis_carterae.AAC.1
MAAHAPVEESSVCCKTCSGGGGERGTLPCCGGRAPEEEEETACGPANGRRTLGSGSKCPLEKVGLKTTRLPSWEGLAWEKTRVSWHKEKRRSVGARCASVSARVCVRVRVRACA